MATWFCMECMEDIGDKEFCPYCGTHRLGDMYMSEDEAKSVLANFFGKKTKKVKTPMFTEEQRFFMGIHPNDETYRKTMELDILSKDYRK